eukprot:maker-scaffold_1-snap-gene-25.9-mRNA-1 protein AED:0.08 eAED:0.08 QI:0/0/0/1/1/1/2/0/102
MSKFSIEHILLYRRILRLHRSKLPAQFRSLGDSYVKKEFRHHRTAKHEFLLAFRSEWEKYAIDLEQKQDSDLFGKPLDPETHEKLSEQQLISLEKMKEGTQT